LANSHNMDNISILDQIINNQKAEEVAKLNAVEIVNNLLSELNKRERDVLTRRFGLQGNERETLENVGNAHQLTRERIRQIENFSIKKLRELTKLEEYVKALKKVISELLEEHGGLMEKDYLLNLLLKFSVDSDREEDERVHKSHLNFLISKLLANEFEEVNNLKHFKSAYKLKYQTLDHLEELAAEMIAKIKEARQMLKTEELIAMLTKLESYRKHEDKFKVAQSIDISKVLGGDLFEEKAEVINNNKILYSLLKAAKDIEQSKFGDWGIKDWRDISPKTINDKIYLVLKYQGKPMHFAEISDRINQIGFDSKKANAATVHNELISGDRYILVGRGLYGLKDWGYQKGTVIDVISDIMRKAGAAMSKDDIIDRVLEKRLVKRATIMLALMNKEKFEKQGDKYCLKGE